MWRAASLLPYSCRVSSNAARHGVSQQKTWGNFVARLVQEYINASENFGAIPVDYIMLWSAAARPPHTAIHPAARRGGSR
jgi:hypothetical protein